MISPDEASACTQWLPVSWSPNHAAIKRVQRDCVAAGKYKPAREGENSEGQGKDWQTVTRGAQRIPAFRQDPPYALEISESSLFPKRNHDCMKMN